MGHTVVLKVCAGVLCGERGVRGVSPRGGQTHQRHKQTVSQPLNSAVIE